MKHYKTIQINGKQVRLHRYIMEQKLNRKLQFNEIVHHVNGDKHDNRIENLSVVSRSEHLSIHPEIREKWNKKNQYKFDIDSLIEMYQTMSISEISKYFNVSAMTIWYRFKKAGVKTLKIDHADLVKVREMLADNIPQKDIAKKFNVSIQTISNIKTGYRYGNK
jgi:transposase